MWVTVSLVAVYVGLYLFIVFVSLSLACGLYYLAELIEEYTLTTRRILTWAIRGELLLHALLLLDRLPVWCLGPGVVAQLVYLRMLRRFPYLSLTSADGLLASGAFLASNGVWVWHFWSSMFTVEYILAFLLISTWLVPFGLFLSMAGDQAVLPGAGGYPYTTSPPQGGEPGKKARRGLALRIFDVLRRKRDAVLPDVYARLPASAGLFKEKL